MKLRWTQAVVLAALPVTLLVPSVAYAQLTIYTTNFPPTLPAHEINNAYPASGTPANTAATLLAVGKMGAKFFGDSVVANMDFTLRTKCQQVTAATTPGSSWPEGCDINGLSVALKTYFFRAPPNNSQPQNWVVFKYNKDVINSNANKTAAVRQIIDGFQKWKSPALVPLRGSVDHWITIFQVKADISKPVYELNQVRFFDGGTLGSDSFDPYLDGKGHNYYDGVQVQPGSIWFQDFYWIVDNIAATDPYFEKFVAAIEPPTSSGSAMIIQPQPTTPNAVNALRAPGVVADGEEMDALVAEERVLEALLRADLLDDPILKDVLEEARPGPAFAVYGENMDEEIADYFLVPMIDKDGFARAIVRLSMADGAFEHLLVLNERMPFLGVTPQEAEEVARGFTRCGETLLGGTLTWSPRRSLGGSPLDPYYEFYILGPDREFRGRLGVSLTAGSVRGLDRSLEMSAKFER